MSKLNYKLLAAVFLGYLLLSLQPTHIALAQEDAALPGVETNNPAANTNAEHGAEYAEYIVQLQPGFDVYQLAAEYQAVVVDSIDSLSFHRLQSRQALMGTMAYDSRVIALSADAPLVMVEARPQPFISNDAEALGRYFGYGSGDDDHEGYDGLCIKEMDKLASEVLITEPGESYDEKWTRWSVKKTKLDKAHDKYAKGAGVTVAVLDTGVDLDHVDLRDHLLPGYDFVDNDNWPDDVRNGFDEDRDGQSDEGIGHGTHVAGIVVTAAPYARILPVRVLNTDGIGSVFDIARGVVYATDQGARVINLSLSAPEYSPALEAAVRYATERDVLVVAAAGNESELGYPARQAEAFAIGPIDYCGNVASFGQANAYLVDVFAPGELIYSTYADGDYAWWSGSSMAAPYVSGAAALMMEQYGCDANCARQLLVEQSKEIKSSGYLRGGYIEVEKAVKEAAKYYKKQNDKDDRNNDCDKDATPQRIVLEYTGASCYATSNMQEGDVECEGTPDANQEAYVRLKTSSKLFTNLPSRELWPGDLFTIWLEKPKEEKLEFEIFQSGNQTQELEFKATCRAQFDVGDQFGSFAVHELSQGWFTSYTNEADDSKITASTNSAPQFVFLPITINGQ